MRPRSIFLLCFAIAVMTLPKFLNAVYALFVTTSGYALLWFISNGLVLVSCYGLWNMRKWGVYLFVGAWLAKIAGVFWFPLEPGRSTLLLWFPIVVLLIYLAVVAHHWQDMDKDIQEISH